MPWKIKRVGGWNSGRTNKGQVGAGSSCRMYRLPWGDVEVTIKSPCSTALSSTVDIASLVSPTLFVRSLSTEGLVHTFNKIIDSTKTTTQFYFSFKNRFSFLSRFNIEIDVSWRLPFFFLVWFELFHTYYPKHSFKTTTLVPCEWRWRATTSLNGLPITRCDHLTSFTIQFATSWCKPFPYSLSCVCWLKVISHFIVIRILSVIIWIRLVNRWRKRRMLVNIRTDTGDCWLCCTKV